MGFQFHPAKKFQAIVRAFISAVVFAAIAFIISSENAGVGAVWSLHPAWFLAAGLFLVFTIALVIQLVHISTTKYILEFGASALIDRRRVRMRIIPYAAIEIFSPDPERLFQAAERDAEFRQQMGLRDYVNVSARLLDSHEASRLGDFTFFEKVRFPEAAEQEAIVRRLRSKIARFERLTEDDGDDADEFDQTNA